MSKEPVGSLAEEAAKLFAVLQNAASDAPAEHDDSPESSHKPEDRPEDPHEHKLGPDCVWCPVCQLIHKVRNTSPETIEQLSTAAAHVLGSVRSLLEAAADAARQAREDAASRSSPPDEEPARSRVDRIDVSEDPEPWD
ncbi:hypothetical protein PWY87_00825 [Kribbella solani]|uniref:hypothetical protein n=1 Tax=Kribbella solani TaxID=236067 RepID=UPI0029B1C666|nr:hypothetical protein [Kribbella solani]MDX2970061.1 hypothetical protein [Kribbella solani]MDX3000193.1 hypothetical protein [Kribbella solani]